MTESVVEGHEVQSTVTKVQGGQKKASCGARWLSTPGSGSPIGRTPHERSFVPRKFSGRSWRPLGVSIQPLQVPSWVALVTSMKSRGRRACLTGLFTDRGLSGVREITAQTLSGGVNDHAVHAHRFDDLEA